MAHVRFPLALLLATLALALVPAASAGKPLPPVPVGACVENVSHSGGCSGGHAACVYGFSWVPQCVDGITFNASGPCNSVSTCKQEAVWILQCVGDSLGGHSCHA